MTIKQCWWKRGCKEFLVNFVMVSKFETDQLFLGLFQIWQYYEQQKYICLKADMCHRQYSYVVRQLFSSRKIVSAWYFLQEWLLIFRDQKQAETRDLVWNRNDKVKFRIVIYQKNNLFTPNSKHDLMKILLSIEFIFVQYTIWCTVQSKRNTLSRQFS